MACSLLLPLVGTLLAGETGGTVSRAEQPAWNDEEALSLGRRVLAVRAAIWNPRAPGAMSAIVDLGTDSRYYTMVRGWLVMQLHGDKSVVEARKGRTASEICDRIEFLEQAIRAIDLE